MTGSSANLTGLADAGGRMLVHMPKPGSSVINAGSASLCLALDQRGYSRNGTCDKGATEYAGLAPTAVVTKTYYFAGAQLIAMREITSTGSALYFIHSDHLGSSSLTTNSSGAVVSRQLFYAYGEVRWSTGTMPTTIGYTGQRRDSGLGSLMFYNARYYSPYLNRFISADTIVPGAGNPQAFNRYMYTLGNPLKYIDPSGHCTQGQDDYDQCLAEIQAIKSDFGFQVDDRDHIRWQLATLAWLRSALTRYRQVIGQTTFDKFLDGCRGVCHITIYNFEDYWGGAGEGVLGQWAGDGLRLDPEAFLLGTYESAEVNFKHTVIHEMTHGLLHIVGLGLTEASYRQAVWGGAIDNPGDGPTDYARDPSTTVAGLPRDPLNEDLVETLTVAIYRPAGQYALTESRKLWVKGFLDPLPGSKYPILEGRRVTHGRK